MGIGLLGLAGWFIASAAVAGLAVASTFSFLFPSAGVQALAWSRTLARYWERTTSHRATLELVAELQTALFAEGNRLGKIHVEIVRAAGSKRIAANGGRIRKPGPFDPVNIARANACEIVGIHVPGGAG